MSGDVFPADEMSLRPIKLAADSSTDEELTSLTLDPQDQDHEETHTPPSWHHKLGRRAIALGVAVILVVVGAVVGVITAGSDHHRGGPRQLIQPNGATSLIGADFWQICGRYTTCC